MQCTNEMWLPVPQYEGLYEVSNLGRVRSTPRNGTKGGIIKPFTKNGYLRVGLRKCGKQSNKSIHRLVAKLFVPNPESKPEVNHIDGNKQNNRPDNLEWVTSLENIRHGWKTGLYRARRNDPTRSKMVDMFSLNGEHLYTYPSIGEAHRKTGIGRSCIQQCCACKKGYKTAGGYVWKYHSGGDADALDG